MTLKEKEKNAARECLIEALKVSSITATNINISKLENAYDDEREKLLISYISALKESLESITDAAYHYMTCEDKHF